MVEIPPRGSLHKPRARLRELVITVPRLIHKMLCFHRTNFHASAADEGICVCVCQTTAHLFRRFSVNIPFVGSLTTVLTD